LSDPIRIGLVGLGRAGWGMHCKELESKTDKFTLVAACDIIPERCKRFEETYGGRSYESVRDLINDPEVELVDIATRSNDHYAHGIMALEAGKMVFMEKPMCLTWEEAKSLRATSERTGSKLFVRHNRRFETAFLVIREIIASGKLGEVHEVKLARVGYQRRDDWQTIMEFGGGQLLNWGPHIVDHACQLLGAPIASMWSDLKRVAAVGDAEDHLKIVLKGENGRIVDLEISGGAALGAPEYLIWGSRGALTCTGDTIQLKYLDPSVALSERTADPGTPGEGFGSAEKLPWIEETIQASHPKAWAIWDELYSAIREATQFPVTLDEAVQNMWVISQAKLGTQFE